MDRRSGSRSPRSPLLRDRAWLLSSAVAPPPRTQGPYDWTKAEQWDLPKSLREVSGLAFTADGRLFAHDDERAIVYQLDYSDGAVVKRFALGDPPDEDDFEAIATTSDTCVSRDQPRAACSKHAKAATASPCRFRRTTQALEEVRARRRHVRARAQCAWRSSASGSSTAATSTRKFTSGRCRLTRRSTCWT